MNFPADSHLKLAASSMSTELVMQIFVRFSLYVFLYVFERGKCTEEVQNISAKFKFRSALVSTDTQVQVVIITRFAWKKLSKFLN